MTYALSALALAGLGYLLHRTFMLPRKNLPTLAEQKRAAFGQLEKKYRITQPAKRVWWQQRGRKIA